MEISELKDWLEIREARNIDPNKSSWVTIYENREKQIGDYFYIGSKHEINRTKAILFKKNLFELTNTLRWPDVNMDDHKPIVSPMYNKAGTFICHNNKIKGEFLVLEQYLENKHECYLSEDIAMALDLQRKGDIWYAVKEDDIPVVELERDKKQEPIRIKIKTEHLKDYLCARKCGLMLYGYYERRCWEKEALELNWENHKWQGNMIEEKNDWEEWELHKNDIVEGTGHPYGSKTHISRIYRTDVNVMDDVPEIKGEPTDTNIDGESFEVEHKGKRIQQISAEMQTRHWITPVGKSPRVRGDVIKSKIKFINAADGTKVILDNNKEYDGWLWFKPKVIEEILNNKKNNINWFSEDTAQISIPYEGRIPFGMNNIGLITVYMDDLKYLSERWKIFWLKYNVTPDGKGSKELLSAQVYADPVRTIPPEIALYIVTKELNDNFVAKYNENFFNEDIIPEDFYRTIHRFIVSSNEELYALCNIINICLIENINEKLLEKLTPEIKSKSLKRMEYLLEKKHYKGKEIMRPLHAIRDLRHKAAHTNLGNKSFNPEHIANAEINLNEIPILSAKKLLLLLAERIKLINDILFEE